MGAGMLVPGATVPGIIVGCQLRVPVVLSGAGGVGCGHLVGALGVCVGTASVGGAGCVGCWVKIRDDLAEKLKGD